MEHVPWAAVTGRVGTALQPARAGAEPLLSYIDDVKKSMRMYMVPSLMWDSLFKFAVNSTDLFLRLC